MVVASFLVKDLHIEWQRGAREFMHWLRDGDLASNNHGWQWVAGSGTDAAPYFRVFNPVTQGRKFDPDGDYVRRYVPELRSIEGAAVHEPWALPDGFQRGTRSASSTTPRTQGCAGRYEPCAADTRPNTRAIDRAQNPAGSAVKSGERATIDRRAHASDNGAAHTLQLKRATPGR